jgi:hypothetical protein
MHIDCIEIRYDTIHIEFSISNFITIRYVSNFLYRISTRNKVQFRIGYIELRYSQKRVAEEMKETKESKKVLQ